MLLVKRHTVGCFITPVRFRAKLATDRDLCSETDNADSYLVTDQGIDGLVNITRVRGQEGAKNHQHFPSAMVGGVTIATS